MLLAPISESNEIKEARLNVLKQQGFARIFIDEKVVRLEELKSPPKSNFDLIVDRIVVSHEEDFYQRLADAIEIAFHEERESVRYGVIVRKIK